MGSHDPGNCPKRDNSKPWLGEVARGLLDAKPLAPVPKLTSFHASFFPFCPLCWPPLFLPFSRHIFALFSPSKIAQFCRAKGTAQSLEGGNSGTDLSTDFGKEIPFRNLREKRSEREFGWHERLFARDLCSLGPNDLPKDSFEAIFSPRRLFEFSGVIFRDPPRYPLKQA